MKLSKIVKSKRGVTLIELLVVVVILGIIAAVVIPMVTSNQEDAYINTNLQNLAIVNEAVQRYAIDHGGLYPTADGAADGEIDFDRLTGTTGADGDKAGTDFGPYLQDTPTAYGENGALAEEPWTLSNGEAVLPTDALR